MKYRERLSIDIKDHFRQHLEEQAKKKKLKLGPYIKAVLKKHTGYKEPDVI